MAIRQHSLYFKLDKEYNKKVLLLLTFNYPNNYTEPSEAKNTDDNIEYHTYPYAKYCIFLSCNKKLNLSCEYFKY